MSEKRFRAEYDPEGRFFDQGRKRVRFELSRALFEEIYAGLAVEQGLDRDLEIAQRVEAESEQLLAREWLRRNLRPIDFEATPAELEATYRRDLCRDYFAPPTIDAEVLFLRAGLSAEEREQAVRRMSALAARWDRGESFDALAEELKPENGRANGRHRELAESELDPRLLAATDRLLPGQSTPLVESLPGLFRLRLLGRAEPRPLPRAEVEDRLRRRAATERRIAVEREAAETIRRQYGWSTALSDRTVLARAAEAEGLDQIPQIRIELNRTKGRILAEVGFLADAASHPSAAELTRRISAEDGRFRHFRLRLLTIPATEFSVARQRSDELIRRMTASTEPAAMLAELARAWPDARLVDLPELTRAELSQRSATLARALERADGAAWIGPVGVPWEALPEPPGPAPSPSSDHDLGPSLAFLAVRHSRLPAPEERVDLLMRDWRAELLGDPDRFLAALAARWQLEMMPLELP